MDLQAPTRQQSLLVAATFAACAILTAGFSLAAKASDQPAPRSASQVLKIELVAQPEPVIAPRPPMEVLPSDASQAFNLAQYRQEIAFQRRRADLARADAYEERTPVSWDFAGDDETWRPEIEAPSPYDLDPPSYVYGR